MLQCEAASILRGAKAKRPRARRRLRCNFQVALAFFDPRLVF